MMMGMEYFWIGVGFAYPDFCILLRKISLNPILSNEAAGGGAFSPLHLTWKIVKLLEDYTEKSRNRLGNLNCLNA